MHLGSRKLAIETLDPRLCLAFGDLAPGYAEVSYEQEASNWQTIQGFFEQGDNYTQVLSVLSGSGPGIVMASTDDSGALTDLFGGDGLAYIKDGVYDEDRLSNLNTIQLSDGSYIARVESAASQSRRLISILPDGRLNVGFGETGSVTTGYNAKVFPHPEEGFLVGDSSSSNFTSIWRYKADGSLDQSFGSGGHLKFSRLPNWSHRFDASGRLVIYGMRYERDTDSHSFVQVRILQDGTLDSDFGTNGTLASGQFLSHSIFRVHSELAGYAGARVLESGANGAILEITNVAETGELREAFGQLGKATIHLPWLRTHLNAVGLKTVSDGSFMLFIGAPARVFLVKVDSNGRLDSDFANDGVMGTASSAISQPHAVFENSQGDFFVYGRSGGVARSTWVMKVDSRGVVDRSFGEDGILLRNYTPSSVGIDNMQLTPLEEGWLLSSGWVASTPLVGQTKRFTNGGEFVESYDFGGNNSELEEVVAASDGGWFVVTPSLGQQNEYFISISRFNANGEVDRDFGNEGRVIVDSPEIIELSVHQERDGSIVVFAGGTIFTPAEVAERLGNSLAIRLDNQGLDTGFGAAGVVRLAEQGLREGIALPGGGQLLLFKSGSAKDLTLLRLNLDGSIATDFGEGGFIHSALEFDTLSDATVDELGRLLLVVKYQDATKLARFTTDGALDLGFADEGLYELPFLGATHKPTHVRARQGLVLIAGTDLSGRDSRVRLVSLDYSGQPFHLLNEDGIKDIAIADSTESVADIQFDSHGDILMAVSFSDGENRYGRVYRVEGSGVASRHNWYEPFDVNNDLAVTPQDALLIIEQLNGNMLPPGLLWDTSNDSYLSPIDALLVINYLNNLTGSGEGEANSAGDALDPYGLLAVEDQFWGFVPDFPSTLVNIAGGSVRNDSDAERRRW